MCFVRGLNLIPASISLTISFFVLFTVSRCGDRKLRIFGYFVAAFLWLVFAGLFFNGLCSMCRGGAGNKCFVNGPYAAGKNCNVSGPRSPAMRGRQGGMMQMNKMPQQGMPQSSSGQQAQ